MQIPLQAWHFLTCDEHRRKPRTKRAPTYLVSSCWPLWCRRSVYGGKLQDLSSLKVSKQAILSFCGQAWHFVTFHHLSRRVKSGFVWQAQYFCDVFRRCSAPFVAGTALWRSPMSFCVAGAALSTCRVACLLRIALSGLRDVVALTTPNSTLYTPPLYTPHFTLHTSSSTPYKLNSTLHTPHFTLHTFNFTLNTAHFPLYTPHSTLYTYTSHFTLYTPHLILHTLHFIFYTPHSKLIKLNTLPSTLYTPHFTLSTPHFTLYTPTPHFTLHILHPRLSTLHSTPYTLHLALHTLHFTLHTPHFTLYAPHSTLYTLHSTLYTLHSTLYTPHFTLYTPHCTLHTWHFKLSTPHFTVCTLQSPLHTLHFTLHTLHCTLHTFNVTLNTPHFPLSTPHLTLYTLHSTLYTLHFTPHTLHFTLHTLHFTPHTLHSTLYTPHSTLYTLHFTLHTPHFTPHPHFTLSTPHFTFSTPHLTLYTLHSPFLLPQLWFWGSLPYVWAFGFVGFILFFVKEALYARSCWVAYCTCRALLDLHDFFKPGNWGDPSDLCSEVGTCWNMFFQICKLWICLDIALPCAVHHDIAWYHDIQYDDFLISGQNAIADAVEWCTRKCRIKRKSVGHQAGPGFWASSQTVSGRRTCNFLIGAKQQVLALFIALANC